MIWGKENPGDTQFLPVSAGASQSWQDTLWVLKLFKVLENSASVELAQTKSGREIEFFKTYEN